MGDVKLALLLGVMLGRNVAVALMLGIDRPRSSRPAVLSPGTAARARKMKIPFGPFLALGAIVALFAGRADPGRVPGAAVGDAP